MIISLKISTPCIDFGNNRNLRLSNILLILILNDFEFSFLFITITNISTLKIVSFLFLRTNYQHLIK